MTAKRAAKGGRRRRAQFGSTRCPTCGDVRSVRYENIGDCPDKWHVRKGGAACSVGAQVEHVAKAGGFGECANILAALLPKLREAREPCCNICDKPTNHDWIAVHAKCWIDKREQELALVAFVRTNYPGQSLSITDVDVLTAFDASREGKG